LSFTRSRRGIIRHIHGPADVLAIMTGFVVLIATHGRKR
jgi:hypothetical protein